MWQASCGGLDPVGQERERDRVVVARLDLQPREVDRPAVEPGRRAGLEPPELEAERAQAPREPFGRDVARAAAGGLDLAGMHQGLEERAGGQDDGAGAVLDAAPAAHARRRDRRRSGPPRPSPGGA